MKQGGCLSVSPDRERALLIKKDQSHHFSYGRERNTYERTSDAATKNNSIDYTEFAK
jgi:hypothetical protein